MWANPFRVTINWFSTSRPTMIASAADRRPTTSMPDRTSEPISTCTATGYYTRSPIYFTLAQRPSPTPGRTHPRSSDPVPPEHSRPSFPYFLFSLASFSPERYVSFVVHDASFPYFLFSLLSLVVSDSTRPIRYLLKFVVAFRRVNPIPPVFKPPQYLTQ